MLTRIRISGYALIEDLEIELGSGLNVLTGETGAGKSIVIDSLALLTGSRASTEAIRDGADRAVLEALFEVDGKETVVRRELFRDRTNRCYLDGGLATLGMLDERGGAWVEIHGQHEDHLLLKRAVQRELLDAYAGAGDLAERVAAAADRLAELERERATLAREKDERSRRIDWLRSQLEEIEAIDPRPGEEEEIEEEIERLRHSEERARLAGEVHAALDGLDASPVIALAALERPLENLAALDPEAEAWSERVASARYDLEDVARDLERYAAGVEHDPSRLAELLDRREALFGLRRKHGTTLAEVVERSKEMARDLAELERTRVRGEAVEADLDGACADLGRAAGELADAREAAADRLEIAVRDRLAELGMGEGGFVVALERRTDADGIEYAGERVAWSRAGLEEVSFLIAPNPGESPKPLSRIASGGELSRVLLALEAAVAEVDRTPTLVFDEIDAGIGGVVAQRVADQLRRVAARHQVLVVTHLAQIAAMADRHLVVEKRGAGGRMVTTVRPVEGEERVREVSRLLGGDPERDVSRHHAEDLLAGRA